VNVIDDDDKRMKLIKDDFVGSNLKKMVLV
jgi:hypothetical protein